MEVFEAVRTLRAVRGFKSDPIPNDVLARILEAGHLSASAMNSQPWHFIVVRDPARVAELATYTTTGPYVATAPLAIAVAIEKNDFSIADAGRAIENMVLVAWSEGVGSNWVGFIGFLNDLKPFLKIPDSFDVLAVLPFGYPAGPVGKGKNRKPLAEIAHLETFDQPYPG